MVVSVRLVDSVLKNTVCEHRVCDIDCQRRRSDNVLLGLPLWAKVETVWSGFSSGSGGSRDYYNERVVTDRSLWVKESGVLERREGEGEVG